MIEPTPFFAAAGISAVLGAFNMDNPYLSVALFFTAVCFWGVGSFLDS